MAGAQAPEAAACRASVKMVNATEGSVVVKFKVTPGWHVYGMNIPDGGPIALNIDLGQSTGIRFTGSPTATPAPEVKLDDAFGMKLPFWNGDFTIKLPFEVIDAAKAKIVGSVRFQGCNGTTCAPPKTRKVNLSLPK